MTENKKGPPQEKGGPFKTSHRSNARRTGSSNSTPVQPLQLPQFQSLKLLEPRLIPLCAPNGHGCTFPPHNRNEPCNAPGKRPIGKGWEQSSYKPEWTATPYNVGVRCGGTLAVLDLDPRNGATELLSALEGSYGRLPAAPEVLTGGGGRHLYFRAGADQASWKLQGVELKAAGSQVVAPGSLHSSGVKYDWAAGHHPDQLEPPELPDWLRTPPSFKPPKLTAVPDLPDPDPRKEAWKDGVLTLAQNVYQLDDLTERAKLYLQNMPPSISGQGGHEVAFRVAVALVRGFLLPEREARLVYRLWNEKLAKPKWSVGDLEHKLADAAGRVRHARWRWGYLLNGNPSWEEVAEEPADENSKEESAGRTIEPRLVYISAHDKFMWFPEGVEVPSLTEWQSFFSENGAKGMLQGAGYTFKKASTFVKEKRCHIVKDFSGHVPSNQRIVQGADSEKYLNLPQTLIPNSVEGPTPLLDHLMHTVSGAESESEEWLWNWAAYVVQNPNVLPGVCVVVRGSQGVGKSKLGEAIGMCRGAYVAVSNSIFREQFNSKWADARFVAAAEVMLADSRKEHNDRFKAWITDPFIEYHKKNMPEFNVLNRIAWWLTSNDDNPVVVPRGDRRFTILESVAPDPALKALLIENWTKFDRREHAWDELQRFRHKLLHYKVDVKKARNPLYNKIHDEHEDASKSSAERFVDAIKENGWRPIAAKYALQGVTNPDDLPTPKGTMGVDGAFVYKVYQMWTKDHGMVPFGFPRFASASVFRTTFKQLPQRRIRGVQYRLWVLPIGVDPDSESD